MNGISLSYRGETIDDSLLSGADMLSDDNCRAGECRDPNDVVASSFESYLSGRKMKDVLDGAKNIGIVINDNNRPTPSYLVLEYLIKNNEWILDVLGSVHIATGSHSAPSDEDLRKLLGGTHDILIDRVHIHDARDPGSHISYGKTSAGTPIAFDKALEDHDHLILVNSVEPHYFAGYTGGRKTIIPGIASFETIERNHSMALDDRARTLALDGNPVNDDMMEAASIYLKDRRYMSVQIVQGPGKLIVDAVVGGDIDSTFRSAIIKANEQFCIPINRLYDIVVTFAKPPMDRSLYQAQKALENGRLALRDGGIIILAAECSDGIGHSTFWDLLTMSDDPDKIVKRLESGYKLGYHKAAKIISLVGRSKVYIVSTLKADELAKGFLRGFSTVEEAVNEARSVMPDNADILVIPDGTVTVPIFRG